MMVWKYVRNPDWLKHLGALEGDGLAHELAAGADDGDLMPVLVDGHHGPVRGLQPLFERQLRGNEQQFSELTWVRLNLSTWTAAIA